MKLKQQIQNDMELSKQITSVQDYECLWIILNAGNEDEHEIPMAKPHQSSMLGVHLC
jgi:hypothetical protein